MALKEKRISLNKNPAQFDRFVGPKEVLVKKSQNLEPIYLNSVQSLDKDNSSKRKQGTNLKKFELKSLRMSIDIVSHFYLKERIFRDEKAKKFIDDLHKKSKERSEKIIKDRIKEKENWDKEFNQRKEMFEKAQQRLVQQKNDISILNKDFIKFQKYRKYHEYNKSIPPIKKSVDIINEAKQILNSDPLEKELQNYWSSKNTKILMSNYNDLKESIDKNKNGEISIKEKDSNVSILGKSILKKSINDIKEKDKLEMNHSKEKEIYLLKETLIRREDVIHDIMKKYKV